MLPIPRRHPENALREAPRGQAELGSPFLHAQPVPTKCTELLQGCGRGRRGVGDQRGCYWALGACCQQEQVAPTTAAVQEALGVICWGDPGDGPCIWGRLSPSLSSPWGRFAGREEHLGEVTRCRHRFIFLGGVSQLPMELPHLCGAREAPRRDEGRSRSRGKGAGDFGCWYEFSPAPP